MVKSILVPINASDYSFKAAKLAINLAKGLGARIILIHVVEIHPYFTIPEYLMAQDDRSLKRVKKRINDWFARIERIAKKEKVTINHETLLQSTSVVESIVVYARRRKVELIVMGTKGASGFKRLLLGSVAQGVSQHAPCSVLIVR
jgi:nucleotide-binding universal stress UspA family protein